MEEKEIASWTLVQTLAKMTNSHECEPSDPADATDALDRLIGQAREIVNG